MSRQDLLARFTRTRDLSLELCAPLKAEDYRIQSMPDVSPPWWNLGHTSWFFGRNILKSFGRYQEADERLEYVMNSYYEALGERIPRHARGTVTRPTTDEVLAFRASVDERMKRLIEEVSNEDLPRLTFLVTTGIQHEQQHQELLVTEIKHILGTNVRPLREAYVEPLAEIRVAAQARFLPVSGGLVEIGYADEDDGWAWDNEIPAHKAYLEDIEVLNRLVTNGEYLEFMEGGGYRSPLLWLSNGWAQVQERNWQAPLYWEIVDGSWQSWTLGGMREVDPEEPVCHLSFYEADAFLRWKSQTENSWKGARLPTEKEWEHAVRELGFAPAAGNLLEDRRFHPRPSGRAETEATGGLLQAAGDLWEWTSSHYEPYPGYRPFEGDLMEYNGKFMDNQRVLRGGSCATPRDHIRPSYRNFWPASTRFQLTGVRPVRDAK